MATVQADVVALEKELNIFEQGIPELLELDMPLLQLIEAERSDPSSQRSARIQLLTAVQGTFQQVDFNGGDLGATSGPQWNVATLVPIYFTGGYSWSALAEFATNGGQRAVKDVVPEVMRLSLEQFKSALDMVMNTSGNGVLGTITTVTGGVMTMTTDGFREELFYVGMPVQIWDTTGATDRGSTTVTAYDRTLHTVTLAASTAVTNAVATDLIVYEGLSVPISIQNGYFGLRYHQSDATSGLWLGLNRATLPNVITPSVNANNSSLVPTFVRQAQDAIRLRIGEQAYRSQKAKQIVYTHPVGAAQWETLAQTISQIYKDPSGNQGVDLMFGALDNMTMGGTPIHQSIHADRTKIDFVSLGNWGRIVGTDTGFYRVSPEGPIIWPEYMSTGAGLKGNKFFYLKTGQQLYNRNPWSGSYIKALAIPTGTIY